MSKQQLPSSWPLLLIFLCCPTAFAQSPAQAPQAPVSQSPIPQPPPLVPQAPIPQPPPLVPITQPPASGPAPPGPPNITGILDKAGHFNTLIRLLKSTQMDSQIYTQLNDSSQSLTVFAPTDNAFGNLSTGTLNSFSDQQKVQLIKFHLISSFLSIPAFQTMSNPMSTEAGSSVQYPLNVTLTGSQVNLTTGMVNTTVSGTVYSDNQLAVYRVDQVLLPQYLFVTPSPAPAPLMPGKKAPSPSGSLESTSTDTTSVKPSGATRVIHHALNELSFAGFLIAALFFCV